MNEEPVTLQAAILAAIQTTLGVLADTFNWSNELVSRLMVASGAWTVLLLLIFVRPTVTPVTKVQNIMSKRNQPDVTEAEFKAA